MPAILSLVILLVVLYCFWLFIRTATPYQMGRVLAVLAVIIGVAALVMLAVSGRLPLAILILIILWPFMAGVLQHRRKLMALTYKSKLDPNGEKKDQTKHDFDQNS